MEYKDLAQTFKDFAMATAIIIGGGWALWKWGFEERLRRKREVISPDGKLTASIEPLNTKKVVVTIQAMWRNQGTFSIYLHPEASYTSVVEISQSAAEGNFDELSLTPAYKIDIVNGEYIMEPKTESLINSHFILPKGKVFLVVCVIGFHEKHSSDYNSKGKCVQCRREIVVNTSIKPENKKVDTLTK